MSPDPKEEPDAISDAIRRTDAAAVSPLRQAGRDIGDAPLGSIHLLRPGVITVRSGCPGATDLLLAGLKEKVEAVDRLLSAPPNLSGQQIRWPAPRNSTDRQRTHHLIARG